MALFGKTTTKKPIKAKKEVEASKAVAVSESTKVYAKADTVKTGARPQKGLDIGLILVRPHVTEKASDLSERGVYAFEIHKMANKAQVRDAIVKYYKVKPLKIAVVNIKSKYTKSKKNNRLVMKKQGIRKALVYLKKGDKIEFA